jgi:hypothetical protein
LGNVVGENTKKNGGHPQPPPPARAYLMALVRAADSTKLLTKLSVICCL